MRAKPTDMEPRQPTILQIFIQKKKKNAACAVCVYVCYYTHSAAYTLNHLLLCLLLQQYSILLFFGTQAQCDFLHFFS